MTKLEALRKEKGLSREALARAVNMSTANMNMLCVKGSNRPSFNTVLRLSEILGVSATDAVELLKPVEKAVE